MIPDLLPQIPNTARLLGWSIVIGCTVAALLCSLAALSVLNHRRRSRGLFRREGRFPRLWFWPAYIVAWIVMLAWAAWAIASSAWRYLYYSRFLTWDRSKSPRPTVCRECGWAGMERHATTGLYRHFGNGDVEACNQCPKCKAWIS